MAAPLPLGGRGSRPRCRRDPAAASSSEGWMNRCIRAEPLSGTSNKRNRGASTPAPELLDEAVFEILLRLPVKSLALCKSVCKTWRAVISDPFFVRAQLQHSASRREQNPSFLITPHTLDRVIPAEVWPTNFSNHFRFYQWHQGDSKATFVHDKDFGGEFGRVCDFAYCDGLVLAPTDTKLYLFNPATRDSITLPHSSHDNQEQGGCYHSTAGLGLDPRTGKYKVVRSFYRLLDYRKQICHMGMEVLTIGESGGAWREILPDPPYPVQRWLTAVTVKGFLFWHLDKRHREPRGILRLSLENEEFSVCGLPDTLDPALDNEFILDKLHGDLALTARTSESPPPGIVTIWVMSMEGDADSQWERRYSINVSDVCRPMFLLPDSGIMLWKGYTLYRYDLANSELTVLCKMDTICYQGRRVRKWKNLSMFNIKPYTESLIRPTV